MKYCLILILLFFSFSCLNNKKVGLVNDLQKGKLSLNNNLSSTRDTLNIIDSLHFFYSYIKDNDIDQDIPKHYITRLFKVIIATKIIN